MDHPKKQIANVVNLLTMGSPAEQKDALDTYFLPNAAFIHPLCRVPSFSSFFVPFVGEINSRWVIWMVYRWYKILSPRIILEVECEEYNQKSQILFAEITQVFSIFFAPFYHAKVHLTTKLKLHHSLQDGKYYIESQEDLYQSNDVFSFFFPWFGGGAALVWFWQLIATGMCILGALVFAPITWLEQRHANSKAVNGFKKGN